MERGASLQQGKVRPGHILHFDAGTIREHLLISFVVLAMARAIELVNGKSLRQVIDAVPLYHFAVRIDLKMRRYFSTARPEEAGS